jgi:hypothetical protein
VPAATFWLRISDTGFPPVFQFRASDFPLSTSPTLASILRSGRAEFNARFAAARHFYPDLDAGAFAEFLGTAVDPLVQAVEKVRADRLADVTRAAYDAALELVGQRLAGPHSRQSSVEEGWRRLLPKAASLVAAAPDRLIPAVCNAIHQLASASGARPGQWIEIIEKLGPQCSDVDVFLKLGQVAAWRAGLAHFRQSAIATADSLPEGMALAAVGAKPGSAWIDARQRFVADPWFDPACQGTEAPGFRVTAQVGSFRGFGGLFVEPPRLLPAGAHFLVNSGDGYWLLTADAFGATFHRASKEEFNRALKTPPFPAWLRLADSRVTMNGTSWSLPEMGGISSSAANDTTLAVTTHLSHAILLIALPRP